MLPSAVKNYLSDNREKHLAELFELLRIPSIANIHDTPYSCDVAADWLARHLRGIGMDVQLIKGFGPQYVLAEAKVDPKLPTVLIYGHYDVQPPDPIEPWISGPFEPTVRDGNIYARGAQDDKGQLFAHIMAVEAWMRNGGLPVNVKMLLEGEEEGGSPHMPQFLAKYADQLTADAAVISDSSFFAPGLPSITYCLRGTCYFEIVLTGPKADLHSGLNGGAVANPINALARMVAKMHDDNGRVTIPGFYDDITPPTEAELKMWRSLPFDEKAYAQSMGLDALAGGEKGLPALERLWARPTLDCNGFVGGWTGHGSKTIIPSQARAKVTTRIVPGMNPDKVVAGMRKFVADNTPAGFKSEMIVNSSAAPVLLSMNSPAMEAAKAAYKEAFGADTAFIRCGATVPITESIQRLLKVDPVMMGLGLPDDNIHSPNEKFSLEQLYGGAVASAALLLNLSQR